MRKLTLFFLTAALLFLFAACGSQPVAASVTPSQTPAAADDVEQPAGPPIGISLAGDSGFYEQLTADFNAACAALGYDVSIVSADSSEKQQSDIESFLAAGVSVVVIDPVDVDALESVLAECETEGVPVINIIDSINGAVSTLISPDYTEIGKSAGERAAAKLAETGGTCLELKTDYDSFTMQLMSDGFANAINQNDKITLAAEEYCGDDEETAYQAVKKELETGSVNFIFAQSAELAHGAIRAIGESGKTVSLVVYGGDQAIMDAVTSGIVDTAMFLDTAQIAQLAIADADGFIKNTAYTPAQFRQLNIYTATADNAAQVYAAGSPYAKAPAQQ